MKKLLGRFNDSTWFWECIVCCKKEFFHCSFLDSLLCHLKEEHNIKKVTCDLQKETVER